MPALAMGAPAAPFALTDPRAGHVVRLTDFDGRRAMVVVFTCNHCPYAQAWEERLQALGREFGDQIGMVLINANDSAKYPADSPAAMAERARERQFSVPYLHDADQSVARAYGAERTPEAFVFDGQRTLVYHGTIDDNYEEASEVTAAFLRDAVTAVLAGQPVARPETKVVGCTIKWAA